MNTTVVSGGHGFEYSALMSTIEMNWHYSSQRGRLKASVTTNKEGKKWMTGLFSRDFLCGFLF